MDVFSVVARIAERGGLAVVLGGLDTGKSTFCRMVAEVAVRLGHTVAYLDADISQSTVGPPATVGLKLIASEEQIQPSGLSQADEIAFIGALTPEEHMLQMVLGTTRLAAMAREAGAFVTVVDTTAFIEGTQGQILKLGMVEALTPDFVVGFQRGGELEPILGAIRRAFPPEVDALPVDPSIMPTTAEQRSEHRQRRLREFFDRPVFSWKVKPSVLVPAIPPDLDLGQLDRILVGMEDGKGHCIGLGILEYRDGLRMISPLDEGAKALRLGSLRVATDFRTTPVVLGDDFFLS